MTLMPTITQLLLCMPGAVINAGEVFEAAQPWQSYAELAYVATTINGLCCGMPSALCQPAVKALLRALLLSVTQPLQGAQAAVKLSATYDAMLTLTQLLCYCCEAWMRKWGRTRIVWRHSLVAGLLCLLVLVSAAAVQLPRIFKLHSMRQSYAHPVCTSSSCTHTMYAHLLVNAAAAQLATEE
jgi:hypothetical protein